MGFCPRCGKDTNDTFCEDCTRDMHPLIENVKEIILTKCSTCDRIKYRGGWHDLQQFQRWFIEHVVLAKNAVILEVHIPKPIFEDKPKEFEVPIVLTGTVSKLLEPYDEEYSIPVKVHYDQCDRCTLQKGDYFEGTLQLRNPRDEVITFIEKAVQKNGSVYLTNVKDVRGGIDFEFTDQTWLAQFAHALHKRFGGELKMQSKLHTLDRETSKRVYRLTAMLRLSKFWRGDIIETNKRLIKITRMGSRMYGFDLRRRKKTMIECPVEGEYIPHEPVSVVVSAIQPNITILSPEDYQEIPLAHPAHIQPGQEIPVVQDSKDKWFIAEQLESERE